MQAKTTLNGLDLTQLSETVQALQADASLARFEFRATNRWIGGGLNRSTIGGFFGAGVEDTSRQEPYVYENAEPPVLLGANESANPVEFLLHAVAGCVTTTFVLHATARGMRIRSIGTELSGDIDVQGLLDLDEDATVGYESIQIRMHVDADASDEEVRELIEFAKAHSPVLNTIQRPVVIELEHAR